MGRTEDSELIRKRFREVLSESGLPQFDPREFSMRFGQSFAHLLTELYVTKVGFLHVHVKSEGEGFWGYQSNILDALKGMRKEGIPCFLVLLKGRLQDDDQRGTDFVADGYILEDWEWMKGTQGDPRLPGGTTRSTRECSRGTGASSFNRCRKLPGGLQPAQRRLSNG